jgi:hypothetical protein
VVGVKFDERDDPETGEVADHKSRVANHDARRAIAAGLDFIAGKT